MLFLIGYLIELQLASLNRAQKWLLVSMNSKVIEEIVPFPKYFAAALVVTAKHLRLPAGLQGSAKLNHCKEARVGYMQI